MSFIGVDFRAGLKGWQYPREPMQGLWRGLGLFVLLFVAFEVFMVPLLAAVISHFGFGLPLNQLAGTDGMSAEFVQGFMVSMFPSMLLLSLLSWGLVQRGLPHQQGRLPLAWPQFGVVGWLAIVVVFLLLVGLLIGAVFSAVGADPASTKGMIEKSLASVAANKLRFALIVPGVVLGAPVAEELLFRGYLFAALAPTRIGRPGAVLVSSALWAVAHAGPAPWAIVGGIFLMGLVLGTLLLRFGTLWVTIVLHAVWNGVQAWGLYNLGNQ